MSRAVISDTSCLIALSNIDLLHILKDLYQEVIITKEVKHEFGERLPEWIKVSDVKNQKQQAELEKQLDKGEASSIALALELKNSVLIIDEVKGRKIAKSFKLNIIGTIGVLLLAKKKGFITDVIGIILKMVNKGFRLSDKLIDRLINKYGKD